MRVLMAVACDLSSFEIIPFAVCWGTREVGQPEQQALSLSFFYLPHPPRPDSGIRTTPQKRSKQEPVTKERIFTVTSCGEYVLGHTTSLCGLLVRQNTMFPTDHLLNPLTFWRQNFFFLILAQPIYKMWIIQEPNTLELWKKLNFEEE